MATTAVTVTITDDGHHSQPYAIKPTVSLEKALNRYCKEPCPHCSNAELFQLWCEAIMVRRQFGFVPPREHGADNV